MSIRPTPSVTPAEYLAIERAAQHKSEYYRGEMFAMTGASREHNLIVGNLVGELRQALRDEPCEVYPSDMRVKIDATVPPFENRPLTARFTQLSRRVCP